MKKNWFSFLIVGSMLGIMGTIALAEDSSDVVSSNIISSSDIQSITSSSTSEEVMTASSAETTKNTEEMPLKNLQTIDSIQHFYPEQYGVLSKGETFYYETAEDAKDGTNPKEIDNLTSRLVKIVDLYTLDNQSIYHFFSDSDQEGFIEINKIDRTESKKFVTITDKTPNIAVYKDMKLEDKVDESLVKNKTLKVQEEFTINEDTYFSLVGTENKIIGFINKKEASETENAQGAYQSLGSYLNISEKNKDVYQNFEFDKKNNTSNLLNQTFLAKGIYYHSNGENYLSVFNQKNKWIGYINQKDVNLTPNKQGNYQAYGKYVTLTKKNYDIWGNFAWKSKAKAGKYANQTLIAKGIYYHFNGEKYLSLYDNKDNWLGYINANGTTIAEGAQGSYYSYNKFVTIKSKNYDFWNSFKWSKRGSSSSVVNQTFKARGIYYHFNGSKYLSVYDNKGKWLGYINQNAASVAKGPQGSYQNFNKYVSVTTSNYSIWQNFDWKKKSSTKNYRNQTLHAKGIYRHYNGEAYYSLYNNKKQWLGYVNKNGVSLAEGRQGIYHSYWKNVTFSSSNYPVWRDFNWKKQNTSFKVSGKTLMARGIYYHFNGSSYYTIYNGNTWVGYINVNAAQNYDMNKLIPNTESLLAVHQITQQKILDSTNRPSSIIDKVLSMPTISRNQITFRDNHFVISLKGRGLGMDSVKLTAKEIAPGVNYRLLPADQIKGAIPKLKGNQKYIALTFDDGPNPYTTPQLLNILKQKKVKASFFMVGNAVNANPYVAKRVANEGHQIGSHSYSHPQLTGLSTSQIQQEMRATDKAIYYATGKLPKTFRPPYGAINRYVSNVVSKPAIMWSIDTRDWESRNPYMINNVVNNNHHSGAIILLHDIHQPSVNSVSQMIDNLRQKGYQFVTIDELYEMGERPLNGYFSQYRSVRY
ncbi:polysaccharide deacetylase family protein [Vagococcus carniphilus]|uniref:polysaccharide deacetylase family protein n=1 Tax=Vagococcus carniphilus TaxID=218144 RepID=UPI003BAD09F0